MLQTIFDPEYLSKKYPRDPNLPRPLPNRSKGETESRIMLPIRLIDTIVYVENPVLLTLQFAQVVLNHEKHPSKYFSVVPKQLVTTIVERHLKPGVSVNVGALCVELYKQRVLRNGYESTKYGVGTYVYVNKKKLNNAIKKLLNKFLIRTSD